MLADTWRLLADKRISGRKIVRQYRKNNCQTIPTQVLAIYHILLLLTYQAPTRICKDLLICMGRLVYLVIIYDKNEPVSYIKNVISKLLAVLWSLIICRIKNKNNGHLMDSFKYNQRQKLTVTCTIISLLLSFPKLKLMVV